jgi:hypothetical protein
VLGDFLATFSPPLDQSVLVDANDWCYQPGFWPAFLYAMSEGSPAVIDAYDGDRADIDAFLDRFNGEPWPVFSWSMPDGRTIYLLFCNLDADRGILYLCRRTPAERVRIIATLGYDGPGMDWSDLQQLAGRDFLLQLPAVGDTIPEAEDLIVAALGETGIRSRRVRAVAADLIAANQRRWR